MTLYSPKVSLCFSVGLKVLARAAISAAAPALVLDIWQVPSLRFEGRSTSGGEGGFPRRISVSVAASTDSSDKGLFGSLRPARAIPAAPVP